MMMQPSTGGGGSGTGQAGAAPAAAGDAGTPNNEAGAAGATGPEPVLIDGCADLDGDQISDCSETILKNAQFATDVNDWSAQVLTGDSFSTDLAWDELNAWGTGSTGSAKVNVTGMLDFNGNALRGATQCVSVAASQLLIVYANTRIDSDQDPNGNAEVDVSFFDTADCSGVATASFSTPQPPDAQLGTWLTLHAGSVTTASTKSALITLGVAKPFRAQSLTARFDNILVRLQSP